MRRPEFARHRRNRLKQQSSKCRLEVLLPERAEARIYSSFGLSSMDRCSAGGREQSVMKFWD